MEYLTRNPVTDARIDRQNQIQNQQRADQQAQQQADQEARAKADYARGLNVDAAQREFARAGLRGLSGGQAGVPSRNTEAVRPKEDTGYSVAQASAQGRGGYAPTPAPPPAAPPAETPIPASGSVPAWNGNPVTPLMAEGDPAMEVLFNTPGAGRQAMEAMESRRKAREDGEEKAIIALAAGDFTTYQYWKQRSGLQVPAGVEQDREIAQVTGRGMALAKQYYASSPQQGMAFTRAYIETNGDMAKAFEVAGPPRDKPNWTTVDLMRDGQTMLAQIDQYGTVRIPTAEDGTPYQRAGSGSSGGDTALVKNIRFFVQSGIAQTAPEAAAMLSEAKASPYKRTELIQKIYTSMKEAQAFEVNPRSDQELWEEATVRVDTSLQGGAASGQPPAPTAAPAPVAAGGGQYPDAQSLDPGQWQAGTVYQTPRGPAKYLGNDEWELQGSTTPQ